MSACHKDYDVSLRAHNRRQWRCCPAEWIPHEVAHLTAHPSELRVFTKCAAVTSNGNDYDRIVVVEAQRSDVTRAFAGHAQTCLDLPGVAGACHKLTTKRRVVTSPNWLWVRWTVWTQHLDVFQTPHGFDVLVCGNFLTTAWLDWVKRDSILIFWVASFRIGETTPYSNWADTPNGDAKNDVASCYNVNIHICYMQLRWHRYNISGMEFRWTIVIKTIYTYIWVNP